MMRCVVIVLIEILFCLRNNLLSLSLCLIILLVILKNNKTVEAEKIEVDKILICLILRQGNRRQREPIGELG